MGEYSLAMEVAKKGFRSISGSESRKFATGRIFIQLVIFTKNGVPKTDRPLLIVGDAIKSRLIAFFCIV